MKIINIFIKIVILILFYFHTLYGVNISNTAFLEFKSNGKKIVVSSNISSLKFINSKKKIDVWIEERVNKNIVGVGELVEYTILVHNEASQDVNDLDIIDILPASLKYIKDIAKDKNILKVSQENSNIIYHINKLKSHSTISISFLTQIGTTSKKSITNIASLKYHNKILSDSLATVWLKDEFVRDRGFIIGRVYNKSKKGVGGVKLYLEDGRFVVSDKNGRYHFEDITIGTHVIQIDRDMLPKGYIIDIDKCSQFVDIYQGSLRRVDFQLDRGVRVVTDNYNYKIPKPNKKMSKYFNYSLESIKKAKILYPPKDFVPSVPSISIAFAYNKKYKAQLWLNNKKVDMLNYDGKVSDKNISMVIDRYRGVDLLEHQNIIEVKLLNKSGKVKKVLKRVINVASIPSKIEYLEDKSYPVADGKHSPVLAVKFIDSSGYPLRDGIIGEFRIDSPYKTQQSLDSINSNPLSLTNKNQYSINSNGIAYIKLQPTTKSGEVILRFTINNREEIIRAYLTPKPREWILVGFVEGSLGYKTITKRSTNLKKRELEKKKNISFFAKGKIRGNWLLTIAYNSKKSKDISLFQEIDPRKYYTLYADASSKGFEASSRKKLYVKLEKSRFSLMFGDFNTNLTKSKLSKYSRKFTGLSSQYYGKNISYKAFITHTNQLFFRDELRGDGTSGYYRLKHQNIIESSESIILETRDRYQSTKIISSQKLYRFRDYKIDYERGEIYFKEPIYLYDRDFNPIYIIASYETKGDGDKHYTYGGRASIRGFNNKVEVGGSYIVEDSGRKKNMLIGADATISISQNSILRAEYAKTKNTKDGSTTKGKASLIEFEHISKGLYFRAYYRYQEDKFGLGQLSNSFNATKKMGMELKKRWDNRVSIQAKAYKESDLTHKSTQELFDIKLAIEKKIWSSYIGYRYAKKSQKVAINQLLLGLSHSFLNQRAKISLNYDYSLNKDDDSLYPTKTVIKGSYILTNRLMLFANYELSKRDNKDYKEGQIGIRYMPWQGMKIENSTLREFYNDTTRIYNTLGIRQNYTFNSKLNFNFGYEEAKLIEGNITKNHKPFKSYSLGVNYHLKNYSALLNLEKKHSLDNKKLNLKLAVYSQANDDLALAFSGEFNRDYSTQRRSRLGEMKLLFAYRPNSSRWTILDKLEYIYQKDIGIINHEYIKKLINNLNINYAINNRNQISLQYGLKYIIDSIDNNKYKGVTHFLGLDTTMALNRRWDLGLHSSILHFNHSSQYDYSLGAYLGYNISDNMLFILGYNIDGFRDEDFLINSYNNKGIYVKLKAKFNQKSLTKLLKVLSW